ncbi:Cytidylate kinase-like family protein [Caprobacter fermentans]|uniref:Cytidylate kinase-like family protein n=2 Tax=Caproicibacter fermentans TaxID=2576756 RepID=A0A6N8I1J9_9FIRM|nr:Cytidylate kinase-like family protein [Caproicibacter fermentans]
MKKKIITISREFGSGGRTIAKALATRLGIAYYDKELVKQMRLIPAWISNLFQTRAIMLQARVFLPIIYRKVCWVGCVRRIFSGMCSAK